MLYRLIQTHSTFIYTKQLQIWFNTKCNGITRSDGIPNAIFFHIYAYMHKHEIKDQPKFGFGAETDL